MSIEMKMYVICFCLSFAVACYGACIGIVAYMCMDRQSRNQGELHHARGKSQSRSGWL